MTFKSKQTNKQKIKREMDVTFLSAHKMNILNIFNNYSNSYIFEKSNYK